MELFNNGYSDSVESINTTLLSKIKNAITNVLGSIASFDGGVFAWELLDSRKFSDDEYAKLKNVQRVLKQLKLHYMSNLCDTVKYPRGRAVDFAFSLSIFDDSKSEEGFDILSKVFESWDCITVDEQKKIKVSIADHNDTFAKLVGVCIILDDCGLTSINIIDSDPVFEKVMSKFPGFDKLPLRYNDKDPDTVSDVECLFKSSGFSGDGDSIVAIGKNLCGNKHMDYYVICEISPDKRYAFDWVMPLPYSKSYKYVVGCLSPNGEEISGKQLLSRLYLFRLSLWFNNYNYSMVKKYVLPLTINANNALDSAIKLSGFEPRRTAVDLNGIALNQDAFVKLANAGYFEKSCPYTNFVFDKGVSKFKTYQLFLNRNGGSEVISLGAEKDLFVDKEFVDVALKLAAEYQTTPPILPSTPNTQRLQSEQIESIVSKSVSQMALTNKIEKKTNDAKRSQERKKFEDQKKNWQRIPEPEVEEEVHERDDHPRPKNRNETRTPRRFERGRKVYVERGRRSRY